MIEDETGIRDVGVDQLVLPAAVVDIAVVDLTILINMIIQGQLRLAESLPVDDDVIRL